MIEPKNIEPNPSIRRIVARAIRLAREDERLNWLLHSKALAQVLRGSVCNCSWCGTGHPGMVCPCEWCYNKRIALEDHMRMIDNLPHEKENLQ